MENALVRALHMRFPKREVLRTSGKRCCVGLPNLASAATPFGQGNICHRSECNYYLRVTALWPIELLHPFAGHGPLQHFCRGIHCRRGRFDARELAESEMSRQIPQIKWISQSNQQRSFTGGPNTMELLNLRSSDPCSANLKI